MTVPTNPRRSAVSTIRIAYNNFVAETFVGRLRLGPAGVIAFSPIPGVILVADPCGPADAIEVRIAWQALDHRDLDLVFPMLESLYGTSVAGAAVQRYDSEVAVRGHRRTRMLVHRLLSHVDAMDRDQDSALLTALWWFEAEMIAAAIDPRVPLSQARSEWRGWPEAAGAEHLELFDLGSVAPSALTVFDAANDPFGDVRKRIFEENVTDIGKWVEKVTPSADRPDDPRAMSIASAMLACRLDRFGLPDAAGRWWLTAGEGWAALGETRCAEIAWNRMQEREARLSASLGELVGAAHGSNPSYGYLPLPEVPDLIESRGAR